MNRNTRPLLCLILAIALCPPVHAQQDRVKYVPPVEYPLFKQLEKHTDSVNASRDSVTAAIRDRQKAARLHKDSLARELRFDVSRVVRPTAPDQFTSVFHFPPTPQDGTGTCWSFAGTSFFESEVFRLTGRKIKLSEMFTVYFEYVEKVRRFVRERGDSPVGAGSEESSLPAIIKLYGAVPRDVFIGLPTDYPYYTDNALSREIASYLDFVRNNNLWDEDAVIASIRRILDKYMGKPPDTFNFEGTQQTPKQFAEHILKINPDDYVAVMSTLKVPFHRQSLYDFGDNWSRDSSYYNLPLDEWYNVIKSAIQKGYSVSVGGGTAEPGYYGIENLGVIPDFDIPQSYINQDSREYRISRGTTGDNHGLHLVGYLRKGNRDWFLLKDSGSGSRKGQLKGYFFFRDDYVRLKMLSFMVHKDAMGDLLTAR